MEINANAICIIKLENLSKEKILIAQYGIRDSFVQLNRGEVQKWIVNDTNHEKSTNKENFGAA